MTKAHIYKPSKFSKSIQKSAAKFWSSLYRMAKRSKRDLMPCTFSETTTEPGQCCRAKCERALSSLKNTSIFIRNEQKKWIRNL